MGKRLFWYARHLLTPHESNNYKAKSLHHPVLILYLIFLFTLQQTSFFVGKLGPQILGYATNITVDHILELVNGERAKKNLTPLALSQELSSAAQQKGSDMFSKNYWAHVSPTGTTPWDFITSAGYKYVYAGENLAKSFYTSDEVVSAWMKSPTHRANILKPEYSEIGLAVLNGHLVGEETTLIVQEFGARSNDVASNANSPPSPTTAAKPVPVAYIPVALSEQKTAIALPPNITKTASLIIVEFLLVVLFVDSILIWKHKTVRISGHSLAHIIFLAALLGAIGATGVGVIL